MGKWWILERNCILLSYILFCGCYGGELGTFHSAETVKKNNLCIRMSSSTIGGGIETVYGVTDKIDISTKWTGDKIGFSGKCFWALPLINIGIDGIIYYDQFGYFIKSGTLLFSVNKFRHLYPYGSLQWIHFPSPYEGDCTYYWEKPTDIKSFSLGVRILEFSSIEIIYPFSVPHYAKGAYPISVGGGIDFNISKYFMPEKEWELIKYEPYFSGIIGAAFVAGAVVLSSRIASHILPQEEPPDYKPLVIFTLWGGINGTMLGMLKKRAYEKKETWSK